MQNILGRRRCISSFRPLFRHFSSPAIHHFDVDQQNANQIKVHWNDGTQSLYPSIYLRDNCMDGKTSNGQRLFETHQLNMEQLKISDCFLDQSTDYLHIKWNDELTNTFSVKWLFENSCNETHRTQRKQTLSSNTTCWESTLNLKSVCNYNEIEQHKIAVYQELRQFGVCLIDKGPTQEMYDEHHDPPVINLGNMLGFVRSTNYGKYFDVISVPKEVCSHLAYTKAALSVHTDNPYRWPTPGIQLLHCLKQAKPAGESDGKTKLIDGYRIALEIKEKHPKQYKLLTSIKKPFTYYDLNSGYKFHKEQYVIEVNERGDIEEIHFNNRSASCTNWDIDESVIVDYYNAWMLFAKLAAEETFAFEYRLEPGQVLIFNNNRVLHGRNGYVDEEERHLQGCYIDCDTVWARLDAYQHVKNAKSIPKMKAV